MGGTDAGRWSPQTPYLPRFMVLGKENIREGSRSGISPQRHEEKNPTETKESRVLSSGGMK